MLHSLLFLPALVCIVASILARWHRHEWQRNTYGPRWEIAAMISFIVAVILLVFFDA